MALDTIDNAQNISQVTPVDNSLQPMPFALQAQPEGPYKSDDVPFSTLVPNGDNQRGTLQFVDDKTGFEDSKRFKKMIEDSQPGVFPTVLAIVSLLNGNAGPLLQLQEQKRKTNLAGQLVPVMQDVDMKLIQGDTKGAMKTLSEVASVSGARMPELLPFVQAKQQQVTGRMAAQANLAAFAGFAELNMDKDNPFYPKVQFMKKLASSNAPVTMDIANKLIDSLKPHIQNINGTNLFQDTLGGGMRVTPLPSVMDDDVLKGFTGNLLASWLPGVSQDVVMNTLRGLNTQLPNGQTYKPTTDDRNNLVALLSKARGYAAQMAIGEKVNLPPEVNAGLIQGGATPWQVLTKDVTPEGISKAINYSYEKTKEVELAKIGAQLGSDPTKYAASGLGHINLNVLSPDLGTVKTGITDQELKSLGPDWVTLRSDQIDKVSKVIKGYKNLSLVGDMFKAFGSEGSLKDRIGSGLMQTLSSVFGISLSENVSKGQALRSVLEKAINEAGETESIDSREVARLKEYTTGKFANDKYAVEGIEEFKKALGNGLKTYMGSERVKQLQQQSAIQQFPEKATDADYAKAALLYGVDPGTVLALKSVERSGATQTNNKTGAYGEFQIRQVRLDDYNNEHGTKYTINDLKKDRDLYINVAMSLIKSAQEKYNGDIAQIARSWIGFGSGDGNVSGDEYVNRAVASYNKYRSVKDQGNSNVLKGKKFNATID